MKSHDYAFRLGDLVRVVAGPVFVAGIVMGGLQAGARLNFLPPPRPALDIDRTILIHQAEAASKAGDAEVVLIGDSSCLMDVNARQLGQEIGRPVLNLGTLSFLDLGNYAELLRRYAGANPSRLKWIVLLMNPEALRRTGAEEYYVEVLKHYWAKRDFCRALTVDDQIGCVLGIEVFRGRILSRLQPIPLPGTFGQVYGFTHDLDRSMREQGGSILDPVRENAAGRLEFRLAPTLEELSRRFREAVPRGARLAVGITPISEKRAGPAFAERRSEMLRQWGTWLNADGVLMSLPLEYSDEDFARPAHLNGLVVPKYTTALAASLRKLLGEN